MMQFCNLTICIACRNIFYLILSLGMQLIYMNQVAAQATVPDAEEIAQNALKKAVRQYDKSLGKNSFVYSGKSYYGPYGGIKGHQFFTDDYWEQGSVNFEGHLYDSIYLRYDIFKDLLIIENFNLQGRPSPIIIYGPKVKYFTLFDHNFVRMEKDTISNIKEGYYDLMYQGDSLSAIIKRRKELINSNEINTNRQMFVERDRYYLKKNDLIYQVKSKSSILKVLKDRKKELKKYIKTNGLYFKPMPDGFIVAVVKYYESLFKINL